MFSVKPNFVTQFIFAILEFVDGVIFHNSYTSLFSVRIAAETLPAVMKGEMVLG